MDIPAIPTVILIHAAAAFLVLTLGPINLFRPKRDALHRRIGYTWVGLIYITCGSSFFFGLEDGFTLLHGLAVFTTISVSLGLWAIIRGHRILHGMNMTFSYIGTFIAFAFAAFVPQRLIWTTATTNPIALALFVAALLVIAGIWVLILRTRLRGNYSFT